MLSHDRTPSVSVHAFWFVPMQTHSQTFAGVPQQIRRGLLQWRMDNHRHPTRRHRHALFPYPRQHLQHLHEPAAGPDHPSAPATVGKSHAAARTPVAFTRLSARAHGPSGTSGGQRLAPDTHPARTCRAGCPRRLPVAAAPRQAASRRRACPAADGHARHRRRTGTQPTRQHDENPPCQHHRTRRRRHGTSGHPC